MNQRKVIKPEPSFAMGLFVLFAFSGWFAILIGFTQLLQYWIEK